MSKEITRRKVLAATGASIAVGNVGQVAANDSPQESVPEHSVPDVTVRNNQQESGILKIEFTEIPDGEERGDVALATRYQLSEQGSPNSVTTEAVSLSEGTYEVSVSVDGESSESTTVSLPQGGFPDWLGISVRSMPGDRLVVSKIEA